MKTIRKHLELGKHKYLNYKLQGNTNDFENDSSVYHSVSFRLKKTKINLHSLLIRRKLSCFHFWQIPSFHNGVIAGATIHRYLLKHSRFTKRLVLFGISHITTRR